MLFASGDYTPLPVKGDLEGHVVAFARRFEQSVALVVVPRLAHRLVRDGDYIAIEPHRLAGSSISLPDHMHGMQLQPLLGGRPMTASAELPVQVLLADFPVAVAHSVNFA
jgi:maltooligosyltrehalose synthase